MLTLILELKGKIQKNENMQGAMMKSKSKAETQKSKAKISLIDIASSFIRAPFFYEIRNKNTFLKYKRGESFIRSRFWYDFRL